MVNGGPSAPVEPPPYGCVGQSGTQALLPCEQSTLLVGDSSELVQSARQVGGSEQSADDVVVHHATTLAAHGATLRRHPQV
jgi:hypothetical protein